MTKINDITKAKIVGAAKVSDALQDCGVTLSKRGAQLLGLCPFHDDRYIGSFVVNTRGNYYKCFACGAKGDAITALRELKGMTYEQALRYLAAMYNIYVDDEQKPVVRRYEPRKAAEAQKVLVWDESIVLPYLHHTDSNTLLTYLLNLPLSERDHKQLEKMIEFYLIGTAIRGEFQGWTIWWQCSMENRQVIVHRGKMMKYKADGHRDKEARHSTTWVHSLLSKLPNEHPNHFDSDTYIATGCLFGQHLTTIFKDAEVCIVESEKSALICSAFTDPQKRIWLATGGMQGLTPQMLAPLIDEHRYIVLYPDIDGYEQWSEFAKDIGYDRISVSNKPRELWIPSDGEKADIADIMIRRQQGIQESIADIASRRLGLTHTHPGLEMLIDKFQLQLID